MKQQLSSFSHICLDTHLFESHLVGLQVQYGSQITIVIVLKFIVIPNNYWHKFLIFNSVFYQQPLFDLQSYIYEVPLKNKYLD